MIGENYKKLEITIVDDDASIRRSLALLLRTQGWSVSVYASAEEFLQTSSPIGTDCLILDFGLPGMGGLELQRRLTQSEWRHVPVIFLTGNSRECAHTQAIQGGAYAFFQKTVEVETLLQAVRSAAEVAP